jgi:hypothetical protein
VQCFVTRFKAFADELKQAPTRFFGRISEGTDMRAILYC